MPLERAARLAVFASGSGTNLQALLDAFPPNGADPLGRIVLAISDRRGARALDRARSAGAAAEHVAYHRRPDGTLDRAGFEARAHALLEAHRIDVVAFAGFLRIVSPGFVATWSGRLLNVHPSLLPAFPGLHAVRQALDAGVPRTGCTVHFVDAGVDTGPAIVQRTVDVLPGDTEDALQARVQREEHLAYPDAVRRVLRGEARP
ncbi:MAG: phosphoribosylglycinamide formyltransferase [Trueperaceae bacterium]